MGRNLTENIFAAITTLRNVVWYSRTNDSRHPWHAVNLATLEKKGSVPFFSPRAPIIAGSWRGRTGHVPHTAVDYRSSGPYV